MRGLGAVVYYESILRRRTPLYSSSYLGQVKSRYFNFFQVVKYEGESGIPLLIKFSVEWLLASVLKL